MSGDELMMEPFLEGTNDSLIFGWKMGAEVT